MAGRLPPRPFLYAILDLSWIAPDSAGKWVGELARGGVGLIQIRGKDVSDRVLLAAVEQGLGAARGCGVALIVNDRADVARAAGADGTHVGQEDLPPEDARALLGQGAIVGLSTHTLEEAGAGLSEPIDYLAVGPVFPTASKAGAEPVVGPALVGAVRERTRLPLIGIGGIRPENVRQVIEAGADGVAVISGLLDGGVDEAGARARAYRQAMGVEERR